MLAGKLLYNKCVKILIKMCTKTLFKYFSPVKIIRAKITEEVNHHLTSLGLDPFKNRLPQNIFQKQRTLLQREREMKIKVRIVVIIT